MPPTQFWGGGAGEWSEVDRQLARAMVINERGTCTCGHHVDDAVGARNMGWFKAVERECLACKTLDDEDRMKGHDDPKRRLKTYVVDDRD